MDIRATARRMAQRARAGRGDRGETLIELLVTIAIMGTLVVTVLGAIGAFVSLSDVHRKQARAGAYVRAYGEALETAVANHPTAYQECASTANYTSAVTAPSMSGYTPKVFAVKYWTGSAWTTSCTLTPLSDIGIQQVTLQVSSSDKKVTESLVVIIRKPCRSTTDTPSDTACI